MASSVDLTNLANTTLKVHYDKQKMESMAFGEDVTVGSMMKDPEAKLEGPGKTFNYPALAQNAGGVSNSFSQAQALSTTTGLVGAQFAVPLVRTYSVWTVDALAAESGQNDGAFVDTLKLLTDGGYEGVGGCLSTQIYRDGFGHIGRLALAPGQVAGGTTSISGASITLNNAEDDINFLVNHQYFFASAPNADARNGGGTLTCSAVNDGVITFTANVSSLAAVVDGDYIFPLGDRVLTGATTANQLALAGFDAWIAGGASFMGVNTALHWSLQGVGVDLSVQGTNVLDGLIQFLTKMKRRKGKVNRVIMNDSRFGDLIALMENRKMSVKDGQVKSFTGAIGYDSIKFFSTAGTLDITSAPGCPVDNVYAYNTKKVTLISAGDTVRYTDRDGKMILRQGSSDGYEGRTFSYSNLVVRNPGQSLGRLKLAPRT